MAYAWAFPILLHGVRLGWLFLLLEMNNSKRIVKR
jgi:hypothetical protein